MSVELRPYQLEDIPQITSGVKKYLPELPHYKNTVVAEDRLGYLLTHNFGRDSYFSGWVLVDEGRIVGGIAGYCTNGMVTWDLIANEVFLFILPEYRTLKRANDLIKVYRDWALARGAAIITFSIQSGFKEDKFDILIRRQGFEPTGTLYHLRADGMQQALKDLGS